MNKCTVYDYGRYFRELAHHHLEEMILHCMINNINLNDYAQSIIDTNAGNIVKVDFKQRKVIG